MSSSPAADLLLSPFAEPFLQRALAQVLLLGALAAVVGTFVVLRRLSFATDALTHTVFPGGAIALAVSGSVVLGSALAGALTAVLLTLLQRSRRITEDTSLALLLTGFFAVGVVVVSRFQGYTTDLSLLLFGRGVLFVDRAQLVQTAAFGAIAALLVVALRKELLLLAFDRSGAEAQGLRPTLLDLALNLATTMIVVAGVRTVGSLLTIALVIVPAATARVLTDRIALLVPVAAVVGAFGGYLGLVVSYEASVDHGVRLAAGASVVTCLVGLYAVALLGTGLRRAVR